MADQSQWFKLWCSAPGDDSIQRLPVALRWAWAVLGAHTKRHGTHGVIDLCEDNAVLRAEMVLENGVKLVTVCKALPHISVEVHSNDTFTVTWHNWSHYQEDSTARERQAALRSRRRDESGKNEKTSRPKKRTEEKRVSTQNVTDPAGGALETSYGVETVTEAEAETKRGPLSSVASDAQAMRLKLLDERHQALPPRDGFRIWPAAQRLYSQGLPLDTATSILNAMVSRWATILHPWAYLQRVLDAEYREYKIQVQEAEHEATKKLPANVELIGEVMRRASEKGETNAGDKTEAEPWS